MTTDSERSAHQGGPLQDRHPSPPPPLSPPAARRRRLPWHVVAPIGVAGALGAILLVSGWHALRPVRLVEVAPVVIRQAADRHTGSPAQGAGDRPRGRSSGVTVQAPGWLEADPFYTACTALADGIIEQILVLEGEAVEAGQVVARLVDEDAALALARAEADLDAAAADLSVTEADLADIRHLARAATAAGKPWLLPAWSEVEQRLAIEEGAYTIVATMQYGAMLAGFTATMQNLQKISLENISAGETGNR